MSIQALLKLPTSRVFLLVLLTLLCPASHAAMTTPDPENEKQVYDRAVMDRQRSIVDNQRLKKMQEAEFARKEQEAMSLRGSAEQERLNPNIQRTDLEPPQQRAYGAFEIGLISGILLLLVGGILYGIKATRQYEQHQKDKRLSRKANNSLGSEAMDQISQILDTRAASDEQPSGISAAKLPVIDLAHVEVPLTLAALFGYDKMRRHNFIPFKDTNFIVCVAATHPLPAKIVSDLESLCKKKVEVYLANETLLLQLLDNVQYKKQPRLAQAR